MRPPLHREIERNLEDDDEDRVHREEDAVERLAVVQIPDEKERHRALVLIEHDGHQEDAGEEDHGAWIAEDAPRLPALRGGGVRRPPPARAGARRRSATRPSLTRQSAATPSGSQGRAPPRSPSRRRPRRAAE